MFPKTPEARACFPKVFQFCHTGSIVSCFQEAKFVSATRVRVSARRGSMAKRGNNYGNVFLRFARPLESREGES